MFNEYKIENGLYTMNKSLFGVAASSRQNNVSYLVHLPGTSVDYSSRGERFNRGSDPGLQILKMEVRQPQAVHENVPRLSLALGPHKPFF